MPPLESSSRPTVGLREVSTLTLTSQDLECSPRDSAVAGSTLASPLSTRAAATWTASPMEDSVSPRSAPPTRRSARFAVAVDGASATDEDSMMRAMRRKAVLNLDSYDSVTFSKSFLSFSPSSISSNLNNVGIKLGSDKNQICVSTRVLRHMEFDRLTVIPNASTVSNSTYLDEEEANATSDDQLLSHLIGEVLEGGLDDDGLSSLYELKASGRKSKSTTNKSRKRAKLSKSPTVSQ